MIYINLDQPYEGAVANLKHYYAEKANQSMIEHLIRQEAIRLGFWPQTPPPPTEFITTDSVVLREATS